MSTLSIDNDELIRMALTGFEVERQKIQEQIDKLERELKGQGLPASTPKPIPQNPLGPFEKFGPLRFTEAKTARTKTRPPLSPEARHRIALAQKKRWAAYRKGK